MKINCEIAFAAKIDFEMQFWCIHTGIPKMQIYNQFLLRMRIYAISTANQDPRREKMS